uniref:PHD and RING finger domain-containing protein 1 n=1 Tax=Noccaea caerulescens TaxID=107243 RepID=A0A1J3CVP8_NOCCA
MGKRNTFGARNSNRRVRSKDKGSDESDEDYVISDEDEEESEAELKEYASSIDGEASYDGFDGSDAVEDEEVNEVEEEEDVLLRNVEWPKVKTGPRGNRKITGSKSRKMSQAVSDEEDVDLDDADDEEEEIRDSSKAVGRRNVKVGSLDGEKHTRIGVGKRRRVFYEEDEDGDYPEEDGEEEEERDIENVKCENVDLNFLDNGEDGEMGMQEQDNASQETEKEDDGDYEDEDSDEEFSTDEDISLDEEEEEETAACNRRANKNKRKRSSGGGRSRRKKCSVSKTHLANGRKRRGRKSKKGVDEDEDEDEDDDGDFVDDCLPARKMAKTRSTRPRRRCTVASDSDIASAGESDYEYTISEEEREQVREAGSLLRSSVKNVSSMRKATVKKDLPQLRKSPVKKGEKKVELVVKRDVMKNVCGICLSEEDMRRLKGTLDCCSHYFCFTCIMEWSKVESRCPLCKQRFRTISKPARSTPGVDLREVVIPVPERDQVYQPTEEELRSYLDPYENTICTECHQGEDDGLMLLCDLCDSSAHTYCVGLGREVPEGNWYCEGCRPVALGSASSQTHSTPEQQRVSGFYSRPSPLVVSGQHQDASLLVSPRTPFFNGEYMFSPRLPNGDVQGSSPSGLGATTLSRRRTLHRHIQNIINSDRLVNMGSRTGGTSMIANSSDGFVTTQTGHGRERELSQPAVTQGTGISLYTVSEERLPNNNPELLSPKLEHFGSEEAVRRLANNTFLGNRPIDLGLRHGLAQGDPLFGNQQLPLSFMPITMSSPGGEGLLKQRVKAHLKNLSSQIDLGQATFDEISTCSIHTILAACGLEHKSSEVHLVPPPVTCPHGDITPCSSSSNNSRSSLMRGCCYSCFDSFVEDVVKMILDTRQPHWLRLGLH